MPVLIINGNRINRVLSAVVEITHGDSTEARQMPTCQFVVRLPLDRDTMLAVWALEPLGRGRWKTVELQIQDHSNMTCHIWTLHQAYVHDYLEREFPPGSGAGPEQGSYNEVVIRGTLFHNNDYDGENVLKIAGGASASPA